MTPSLDQSGIIDAHVHLFDPTRVQGVPWPTKEDGVLYQPALPNRYRTVVTDLGVTGAIVVEASPWLEDNQWVLEVASGDAIIVGVIGYLRPGTPSFRSHLDRLQSNQLFRGIRYGNLWDADLTADLSNTEFVSDLELLAGAGLALDVADPTPRLISEVVRITDKVPSLRVIIDHLPQLDPPTEVHAHKNYEGNLLELSKRPQVFVKMSEVLRRVRDNVPNDLNFYRPRLDELWDLFGQDRLLYGSDWPNSDLWAPYSTVLKLAREYFVGKGPSVAKKFFFENSVAAYRWVKRSHTVLPDL
jgi:L-fuconolactonase